MELKTCPLYDDTGASCDEQSAKDVSMATWRLEYSKNAHRHISRLTATKSRKAVISKSLEEKLTASSSLTHSRRFQDAELRDYQLWVASDKEDAPYPMIGKFK